MNIAMNADATEEYPAHFMGILRNMLISLTSRCVVIRRLPLRKAVAKGWSARCHWRGTLTLVAGTYCSGSNILRQSIEYSKYDMKVGFFDDFRGSVVVSCD
jgi:hypothetical protein